MNTLLDESERLMAEYMKAYDPSHDIHHVRRVRRTAKRLAESVGADSVVAQLGAIFHDLLDHKYRTDKDSIRIVTQLFEKHNLPAEKIEDVLKIIMNVGYSRERRLKSTGEWSEWHQNSLEFHCVQDADRLDAMGAIGMFRVAAYSAIIDEPLYLPNLSQKSAYEHMDTKLLKLQQTLQTPLAREEGERRQRFMLQFRAQLEAEADWPPSP